MKHSNQSRRTNKSESQKVTRRSILVKQHAMHKQTATDANIAI